MTRERYPEELADFRCVPILGLLSRTAEPIRVPMERVTAHRTTASYELPELSRATPVPDHITNGVTCRLAGWTIGADEDLGDGPRTPLRDSRTPPSSSPRGDEPVESAVVRSTSGVAGRFLELSFCEGRYHDWYRVDGSLDAERSDGEPPLRRALARFLPIDGNRLTRSTLTNITGVGTFITTADRHVIYVRRKIKTPVYPSCLSYAASGTMQWTDEDGDAPHPFRDASREIEEELGHTVAASDLELIAFSRDAVQVYFQLSFIGRTDLDAEPFVEAARTRRRDEEGEIHAVPLDADEIRKLLSSDSWEPSAAAALVELCWHECDPGEFERAFGPRAADLRRTVGSADGS